MLPTPISWRRRSCFGQQPSICHRCSLDGYDKKTHLGVYWQAGTSSYLYLGKLTVKLCSRHPHFRAKVLGNRRYLTVRDRALCGRSAIQHLYSLVVIECMESQQGEVLDNIHGKTLLALTTAFANNLLPASLKYLHVLRKTKQSGTRCYFLISFGRLHRQRLARNDSDL